MGLGQVECNDQEYYYHDHIYIHPTHPSDCTYNCDHDDDPRPTSENCGAGVDTVHCNS